ncbi:MAG: asparagine synthase (glutamine-hydrolyzing), partial [Candidatus Cloacimonetes bacterium]|nr:asparagine synthase (glutamine-hydrolyzing) [Candidatus Cloacimonadota bacterium]
IKSIVEHPSVARKINPQAYLNYLTFQYVPEPDTMFEGINKIPPGHYFRIDSSGIHLASYFTIQFKPEPERAFADFVAEVRETIDNSVNAHRVSDVPRGAFLSSGVDSTIITAMMKQYEDIKTFSVGYNEGKYSELSDAKKSAEKLGTEHHEYIITAAEYQSMLPKLAWHQDEPVADPSAISIFFLARMAREHITVVLSGEGADELFGGYNIYHEPTSLRVFNYVPSVLNPVIRSIASLIPDGVSGKSFLLRGTQSLENRFFGNARIFGTEAKKRITNLDRNTFGKYFDATRITKPWYQRCAGLDDETRMQYIDLNTWLPGNILMKADKMTMANSLELRVPFLDIEVLKLIQRIPTKYKITAGTTKYVLRQAFKDILPPDVTSKRKLGFPVPLRLWLKKEFYPWAIEQLSTGDCQPWVNKTHALKLLEDHKAGKADNSRPLWTILMFLLWKDAFRVSA